MKKIFGFSGNLEDILCIWGKNAKSWLSTGSPWRPSVGDIRAYRVIAESKLSGNVLVLGSTPELRDLISDFGTKPVLVDVSYPMLQKMSLQTKRARQENEIWIKSDWCEVPLVENYFDLVIGDMVFWVLSVSSQVNLLDKISKLLKPDGLFVARFRLLNTSRSMQDAPDIIKDGLKRLDENSEKSRLIKGAMMSDLYDVTANRETHRLDRGKAKELMLGTISKISNQTHKNFLQDAGAHMLSADWTAQTREEILEIMNRKFVLMSEMSADDYESKFYPILSFIKK